MTRILATLILLCAFLTSHSQNLTQNIRGKVVDRESETPLPGVTLIISDVEPVIGATTDEQGNFILTHVPVGRHNIVVKLMGYKEATLQNILVGSAREVILNIPLQEKFREMNEVVIVANTEKHKANNDMATVSSRSFSVDETQRYAASVDDPARMAQAFAGVSSTDDVSNEIIVRGNSPRGLLWRLNGIEIPSPNHFSNDGASGGGVSALSNNMLDNSDFLTGAFPAEYGNALSGVFDVKLRKGNNQQREYALQVGVLGTDIAVEGPFSKNYQGSYLANYRYSTLGLLTASGILDLADINTYQDLAFNINLPTTKLGTFGIFGLGGLSLSKNKVETDTSIWEENGFKNRYSFHSDMGVAGVSHQYFFRPNTYIKTTLATTGQKLTYEQDSISKLDLSAHANGSEIYDNSATRFNTYLNSKISSRNTIRAGAIISLLDYNVSSIFRNELNVFQTYVNSKGTTQTLQAYGQWKYKVSERWTLNSGLHFFNLALTKASSLEPRIGLLFQIDQLQSLSFGAGLHSRMESMSFYNAMVANNTGEIGRFNAGLGLSKALHYVVGYDRQLNENLRLKLEAYYQDLFHVPVSADTSVNYSVLNQSGGYPDVLMINKGKAYNTGLEFTLEKFFSRRTYYLITASLFDSRYKDAAGREFNTRYNAHYRITALGGKEWPAGKNKQNLWALNGKVIYSGGNRYTPINVSESLTEDQEVLYTAQNYALQVPAYWRIDMSASYRINRKNKAHIIQIQIQNATNRENIFGYYFDNKKDKVMTSYQFGLIPVLKYRLEF